MEKEEVREMIGQLASKEDFITVQEQISAMPTTSKMEMRFKQITLELDNMMKRVTEMCVRRKEWEAANK